MTPVVTYKYSNWNLCRPSMKYKTTVVEVIASDEKFLRERELLGRYKDGSKEYFTQLLELMPLIKPADIQGVAVSDGDDTYSAVYRNAQVNTLVSALHPAIRTGYDMFQLSVMINPENHCLGVRKLGSGGYDKHYTWETFKEIDILAENLGSGIVHLVGGDAKVALWAPNRREWVLTDLACQYYSLGNTALYDTLGEDTSEYILKLTKAPIIFCSKDKLGKLCTMNTPLVKFIVCMDELTSDELAKYGSKVMNMSQVIQLGVRYSIPRRPPTPDTLYTISFTSGTTGMPKGVYLNHSHFCSALCEGVTTIGRPRMYPGDKQRYALCFLPLAHIYERQIFNMALTQGIGVGFMHDPNPLFLVENLKIIKPHYFCGVPRILTKFESSLKACDPHTSVETRRALLGLDRCEYIITASAPISAKTLAFIKSSLDVGMRQAYGLTESFAAISISPPYEDGSCGPPGLACEVRLKSVPHMNYDVKNMQGELQLRGPQVFFTYYKNKKATDECLDSDGWFSTGDISHIDPRGRIHIIDRVKNFFKLAQGEYIAPEKIENVYLSSNPLLTQMFVHGDPLKNYLVGIAGIDIATIRKMLQIANHWTDEETLEHLNTTPRLKQEIITTINRAIKGLQGFEKLHNIHLQIEPLKVADDTVTPTLKIKRAKATKFFAQTLEMLYKEGSLLKNSKI